MNPTITASNVTDDQLDALRADLAMSTGRVAELERYVSALEQAAAWNSIHPIGTPVRYWTGPRDGDGRIGDTSAPAQVLSEHTAVVWINTARACVALSHVEVDRD
ncbi:MAG: hypothetical protein ACRD0P_31285 [Stackebrandtia sp.]